MLAACHCILAPSGCAGRRRAGRASASRGSVALRSTRATGSMPSAGRAAAATGPRVRSQRPAHLPAVRQVERGGRAERCGVAVPVLVRADAGRRDAATMAYTPVQSCKFAQVDPARLPARRADPRRHAPSVTVGRADARQLEANLRAPAAMRADLRARPQRTHSAPSSGRRDSLPDAHSYPRLGHTRGTAPSGSSRDRAERDMRPWAVRSRS